MADKKPRVSASGRALARVLDEGGELAKRIRARVHRAQLSRYIRGLREPNAETIALLHDLSFGEVEASGWARSRRRAA